MPRETVNITVVKQETHFAPVMTALLAGRATAPATGTAADGRGERPVADEGAGGRVALAEYYGSCTSRRQAADPVGGSRCGWFGPRCAVIGRRWPT